MERTQFLDLMGSRKPFGMRSAFVEVMAAVIKCRNEPPRTAGDLLRSETAETEPACPHRFETAGERQD
jgi:hypothetical protein